jgi:hypothetical protein
MLLGAAAVVFVGVGTYAFATLIRPGTYTNLSNNTSTSTLMTNSFIFIEEQKEQFSQSELQFMANNYHFITISKDYANSAYPVTSGLVGYSPAADAAAKSLVAANPTVKVLPYYNIKFRYLSPNLEYDQPQFNPDWYLKDQRTGKPIPFVQQGSAKASPAVVGYYVDLSNPDYRKFAENIIVSWMNAAPYGGIALDSADPIGVGTNTAQNNTWVRLIGESKINTWNQGLSQFLIELKTDLGTKLVMYNGFSPSQQRVNRNLDNLQYADGAFNEDFCLVKANGAPQLQSESTMLQDFSIMQTNSTKVLMEQVNYPAGIDDVTKSRLGRYCYGAFLLGEHPGYDFFKFALRGYGDNASPSNGNLEDYIQSNPLELSINFGLPKEQFVLQGDVGYRAFENGYVYVNLSPTNPESITLPTVLTLMNGDVAGTEYQQGSSYTIPPQDAAFFSTP